MAEGLLRHMAGDRIDVNSAGVAPSHVRTEAIHAMNEIGIDISNHRSKSVDEFTTQDFDFVITVCDKANQHCPAFPGASSRIHWGLEDPTAVEGNDKIRLEAFRAARDELSERLRNFLEQENIS